MPIIDESISLHPGQGYDSDAARNLRVHHECWRHFLQNFVETTDARVINYGDCKARLTRHSIGAILGDQQVHISILVICCIFCILMHILHIQEFDKMTCEPHPSCHRCHAGIPEFLRTDQCLGPGSTGGRDILTSRE